MEQKVNSHSDACQIMDHAGAVVCTTAWNNSWQGWTFRASFSESKAATNPLIRTSERYKYWKVARDMGNSKKLSERKALEAYIQRKKIKEELESWWITHFGSVKLFICTDLSKFSTSFVQDRNSAEPQTFIKVPRAVSNVPALQKCPLYQVTTHLRTLIL